MVTHIHANFTDSRDSYDASVAYWKSLCTQALPASEQKSAWEPWFGIHKDRSASLVEEGPIFSLYSASRRRGLSIEQYLPRKNAIEISADVHDVGEDHYEQPVTGLFIRCALSDESATVAQQLIQAWVSSETSPPDMRRLITQLIP